MAMGIVKFFNRAKKFGFITPIHEEGEEAGEVKDFFVYGDNVIGDPINEGDKVEFILAEGKKGIEAQQVKKIASAESSMAA